MEALNWGLDFVAIDRMTLRELRLRRKSWRAKYINKQSDMHWQAWLNWCVQGTKRQGRKVVPVYKNFKQFFDYETFSDTRPKAPDQGLINVFKKLAKEGNDGEL